MSTAEAPFRAQDTQTTENDGSGRSSKWEKYSKRSVKKAPSPKPDEVREKRRGIFLKKVREGREDKRYEQRGEDIMRLDFMRERRNWEEDRARDAAYLSSEPIEEEVEDVALALPCLAAGDAMQLQISEPGTQQQSMLEEELDEVLMREQEEMEALLSFMPDVEQQAMGALEHSGSDDDEDDALFAQVMEEQPRSGGQDEEMDLS
ncbi:hypothetical protein LTR62_006281 [Meristemomyces frigidus]|uniref:Uncharacterized protein n=1 Tax=Meristemomyces frigidus TaxID=1508187 RepID=A0AAN7YEQ9_9PEZI|nr:hypothetical protein LTR62_006281 [Meristemomyces frigidus]